MSAVPKRKLTPAEYLAIDRAAEFRSEFLDGEMFAMAGGSFEHSAVSDNLVRHLGNALAGGPCRTLSHDMRVKVDDTGLYTFPDVMILCGPPEFEDGRRDTLLNPTVVIEVLSPSTERYDRGKKFAHYRRVASLQEYVLVAQDEPWIDRYVRQADGVWGHVSFDGLAAEFALATVPARVRMADVYAGVEFRPNDGPPA